MMSGPHRGDSAHIHYDVWDIGEVHPGVVVQVRRGLVPWHRLSRSASAPLPAGRDDPAPTPNATGGCASDSRRGGRAGAAYRAGRRTARRMAGSAPVRASIGLQRVLAWHDLARVRCRAWQMRRTTYRVNRRIHPMDRRPHNLSPGAWGSASKMSASTAVGHSYRWRNCCPTTESR
jgi:hypothetical protein